MIHARTETALSTRNAHVEASSIHIPIRRGGSRYLNDAVCIPSTLIVNDLD